MHCASGNIPFYMVLKITDIKRYGEFHMKLLYPTVTLEKVTDITPELLHEMNVDAILLDVDNTLAPPTDSTPFEGVQEWIDSIKAEGFSVVICSNNYKKRIRPFSDSVGLECVAMSLKPFPFGFNRAKKKLRERPKSVVVIGDQVYTDVLGANLAGMKSILLSPQCEEHGVTIMLRRRMEVGVRKKLTVAKRGDGNVGG